MVLCPVIGKLQHKHVVLASASPRRQEILSNAGLRFEVVPSRFKEKLRKASFATPYAYAMETAKQKALEKDLRAPDVVIGADTIVVVGAVILEKPVDKQDAYRMLSRLNGKEHSVFTGVAIVHCCSKDGRLDTEVSEFYEETTVKFSELSEELLWEYINSGEPMDKAGGYGIQAQGGMLVEYVHGDFLNVVGFPLNHFCKELARLYYPPRPEDLHRVRHASIPAVDTFENLSDMEAGGSDPGQSAEGGRGGQQADGDRSQAPGAPDAALNGADGRPPLPAGLLELMDGFKASKVLFTACKLKLFDMLKDQGPLKAVDIARKLNACAGGTEWLLDVCVALGLLEKTHRGYSNTEVATLHLASDGEHSLQGLAEYNDAHVWGVFTRLGPAVQEGADQTRGALGVMEEEGHLSQSREMTLQFMRAMHSLSKLTAHHVATAFDLSRFTSACDLGGCTGILARELAQEYPRLQVTVFDLPEVTELSGGFQRGGRQTERIRFVPGDFFKDNLPEADLYVLSRILQDWPDDKLHKLLSRISSSCKPGGGLLVAEAAAEEKERASRRPRLRALSAGQPRSPDEHRWLLQRHGFQDVRVARAGDLLHVVLGTRAVP
ncbi:probable bifunctional dTTP/UTP pyrophosphatase/methyltransferase protein isoform X2 [Physeter macrocephalus]|uniref:Probable bifunctional dTTP/UTP pyrophosphatase/methyltransferase protein isoform X2 n=1 Tax=Physeter macrocephalus TaxID=9755 RepID=A0A455BHQ9_PHYMC|nr:probable bifunctional dTTP/UTP pyrophosphatase/methyltransferase protein isoform X2 [Physeter catodon]|eukprot:XP_028348277.1 probable bifunctional dTTP/UTP pyrophosphatase/methyltransferase protein isoform X2 [Physeter catodon]